jgi:hypothetical protein
MNDEILSQLARERESEIQDALSSMRLDPPDRLLRELRYYISRQVDYKRLRHTEEKIIQLAVIEGGITELTCPEAKFSSGTKLEFQIQLESAQGGWLVRCFRFHVSLAESRPVIEMVRIHLNREASRDPLEIPRCHLHIDNSRAHIPFPIMDPRLILHFICEYLMRYCK